MRSSFLPCVAPSRADVSVSRAITSSPTATDRSGFTVTNTGLSGRLRLGCRGRQIDAEIDGGERRRHHEDDQQHQHHVDERRDIDLMRLDKVVVTATPATERTASAKLDAHRSL